jgi:hypothetical protein
MLLSIVKNRYGETSSLLAVSSVAANIRFTTSAGIDVGFGPEKNYIGNLVPFSGGFAYEENPTITYAPVQGEKYLRQLMSPIPLDIFILSIRSGTGSSRDFIMLANRINDMRNPDFLEAPSDQPAPRFQRFVELDTKLRKAGVLDILAETKKDGIFDILISNYAPSYSEKVREYLELLGLPMPMDGTEDIVFPVYFTVKGKELDGMAISTRSTYDLIQILIAAIDVPQEHVEAGMTINYPPMGLPGKDIYIHSSKDKPDHAVVAVKHRGYWFYIDDTDMLTKLFYKELRSIWSLSIATAADQIAAPVLTVPVSR